MEKELKKKTSVEEAQTPQESIPFDSWFSEKVMSRNRVSAHHYNTLKTFFYKQGLTEQESSQDYDSALKIFGF